MKKKLFITAVSLIVSLLVSISPAAADSVSICDFNNCCASSYCSLTDIVSQITGSNLKVTLYIDASTPAKVTDTTVVPPNISIFMEYPGSIISDGTHTLTINGPFYAEPYQVFSEFAAGQVKFGSRVKEALPQWWGAVVDDTADDTAAVEAALAAHPRVYLTAGIWKMNITVTGDKEIYGNTGTVLRANSGAGGNPIILLDGVNHYILNARVHDLYFQGSTSDEKSAVGLKLSAQAPNVVTMSSFKNLWFENLAKAIYLTVPATSAEVCNNSFDHISIIYPGTHGIHNDKGGYNRFTNITSLYAEAGKKPYSIYDVGGDNVYKNVRVDNPIYSGNFNNAFEDVVVENIASDPPVMTYAVLLGGYFDSIRNLLFRDVDNAITTTGLTVFNGPHVVSNVAATGTLKPDTILLLQPGSYGTLDRITPTVNSLWSQGNDAALWSWDIIGAASRAKPFLDHSPTTTANSIFLASVSEPQYMVLSRDHGYEFEFDLKNTTGADITYGVYFNNGTEWDLTENHYRSIYTVNDSVTVYGAYYNNTSWLTVPNNTNAHVTGTISLTAAGQVVIDYHAMVGVTKSITGHYKLVPASPWSEVRNIEINGHGTSNVIVPDSTRFRMWRKKIS